MELSDRFYDYLRRLYFKAKNARMCVKIAF